MPNDTFVITPATIRAATLSAVTLLLALGATPAVGAAQTVASARPVAATPPDTTTAAAAKPATPPPPPAAAAAAMPTIPITFFGEVRTRSEYDRPGGAVAADAFTYLRTRFGARIDAAPGARIVLQIQDSRVLGAEGNTTTTSPDVLDLHQGYVELGAPWRGVGVALRAGRQEISLANERLVGPVGWSNTGRSFDGARLTLAPQGAKPGTEAWTATLFGATVEERGRRFGTSTTTSSTTSTAKQPDHAVAGLFVSRALGRGALEATALYDGGARYRAYDRADRLTLDARARTARLLGVSAELEGALQVGSQRYASAADTLDQRVHAWLLGARLGTPTAPARRASAVLGVDMLSGDAAPGDGRYGAFSTMFATNHPFYGLMDLFIDPAARTKDRGLVDALATSTFALNPAVSLRADVHHFSLAAGDTRPLGWEGDVILPVRVSSAASVELGYTLFRAERGAAFVGLGEDGKVRDWAYLQLRAGF